MPPPGQQQRSASKFIVFENFEKMNTAGLRQGLPEKELAWQENLQAIAPNRLVVVPAAASSALATITDTIISMFDATISGTDYIIAFTVSGGGYAVNIATGSVNQFAPNGTFSNPDVTTWQADRILIADSTAGYCTWDGTVFVKEGGVSPVFTITAGGNYSVAPTVTISGGSGTGATAHAVISDGAVVAVILDNPGIGYQAGDSLTLSFSGPPGSGATGHVTMTGFPVSSITIANQGSFATPGAGIYPLVFSGGGGSGAAANATVTEAVGGVFFVSDVQLTNSGSGYTSTPTASLSTTGGTQAPSFNVFLGTQSVATIVLDTGGSGYLAVPSVTISGGGGSGATAHATLSGTSVASLVLDTAGSGYTGTPAVTIGVGSGATGTTHVWPFIPHPTTLAVFQGRVWLNGLSGANYTLLQYTGTKGFDDFDSANAAGSLQITDADLVHAITVLRALNNYLFIMGDESVKQIGNISLNSSGNATLFTILTLSSDQGTIYPLSCISFNRLFLFANKSGVYAVFGSSVQKISGDMDGIWFGIDFTQAPQAAIVDLNNIHNVAFLVRYSDPFTESTRSLLLTFNGQRWFPIVQGESLKAVVTASTLAAGEHLTYGSSGTDVRQLLADSATAVSYRLQTAMSHHGNSVQRKKVLSAGFGLLADADGSLTMTIDTENGSADVTKSYTAGYNLLGGAKDVSGSGIFLGMTLTGTAAGLTLTTAALEFQETALWGDR